MDIEAKETLKTEIEEAIRKYERRTGYKLLENLDSIAPIIKDDKIYNLYLNYKRNYVVL